MGVLIDSSVLIEYERGRIDLQAELAGREEEEFFLSVITASELLHGELAGVPARPGPDRRVVESVRKVA
jgi:predicted nucleic acid-binding protein